MPGPRRLHPAMNRFLCLVCLSAAAAAGQPVPPWLRGADMVTNWPHGRTTVDEARLAGIPLLINVTQKDWAQDAHRKGFRAIIYASCMDTFIDVTGFENEQMTVGRLPFNQQTANALLIDRDGRFVDTLMDGTYRLHRKLTCANSTTYQREMLAHLRTLMDRGMDGIFVDNTSPRRIECYGEGMRIGYSSRYKTVLAESPRVQFKDPRLGDVPVHHHLYADRDQSYALRQMLVKIRAMVKEYGADKIMLINGGPEFADTADGTMIESYVCSWAWKGRRGNWADLKRTAAQYAPYLASGGTVVALSYLGETQSTVKDDAYFCFSAARLSGFIWSDYQTLGDNPATRLYRAHLGAPAGALAPAAPGVDYRWFKKGLVVLNGTDTPATVDIPAPAGWKIMFDLYDGRAVAASGGLLRLTLPAQSGHVYLGEEI
jgi:hypothetical protein